MEVLGRGGMSVVWLAEDERLHRLVAVKELLVPPGVSAPELAARARREAYALARLHHPGIVSVFDVVEAQGRQWIVLEYVEGVSLAELIAQNGALPPQRVAEIGLALAQALAAAHQAGVLHRDVKPSNVLVGRDQRIRLTDFGIAATAGDSRLTGTGLLVGSPPFMAPERIRGLAASPASDLWSLAATLYTAVEGTQPFGGPDQLTTMLAVVDGQRRPYQLAGPLSPLLTDLLDRPAPDRPSADRMQHQLRPLASLPDSPEPRPRASSAAVQYADDYPLTWYRRNAFSLTVAGILTVAGSTIALAIATGSSLPTAASPALLSSTATSARASTAASPAPLSSTAASPVRESLDLSGSALAAAPSPSSYQPLMGGSAVPPVSSTIGGRVERSPLAGSAIPAAVAPPTTASRSPVTGPATPVAGPGPSFNSSPGTPSSAPPSVPSVRATALLPPASTAPAGTSPPPSAMPGVLPTPAVVTSSATPVPSPQASPPIPAVTALPGPNLPRRTVPLAALRAASNGNVMRTP